MNTLREVLNNELSRADDCVAAGDCLSAKRHLERAHVLGQSITSEHTRIHWRMFKLGCKMRDIREILGQLLRMAGAATKTPFGIYPTGNTGGADVWFFKPMPIPNDLQKVLNQANIKSSKK